jgi:hypothetical protein
MKVVKIALLLSVCLLLANCKGNANSNNSNSKTSVTNTTTTTTTTSTPAMTPSPQATAAMSPSQTMSSQDKLTTPEAAAQGLFEAFGRHDRAAAAKFASDAAVKELFKESTGTEGMEFEGCDDDEGNLDCAYRYEGGGLIMHMKGNKSDGYKVDSIEFIAD